MRLPGMKHMSQAYLKRFLFCASGLALFGFGNLLGVKAGSVGTNAWNTLALGVSSMSGISFGTATFSVSAVIILIDFLGKGKLGFGTLMNVVLIPFFSDLYLGIFSFIPTVSNPVLGAACSLLGQIIISFSSILYMKPGLGCGPRDTLMVLIGRRFPGAPIGAVKLGIEAGALLAGLLFGAPFGIGTVLVMLLQAGIFQFACRVMRYEPRAVLHEDFTDTLRRMSGRERQKDQ